MEMFNVHRKDVYNFDEYMDLKNPGFGGPASAIPLKDSKGKRVNSSPKLENYQNVVKRDPNFGHQVWDNTYKAMGGDLVHKQEIGHNPYEYPDRYENMGMAQVEVGKMMTGDPKSVIERTNEGLCYTDFSSFVLESAVSESEEEEGCGEDCDCDNCKDKHQK